MEETNKRMGWRFCPYCGAPLSDECDCEVETSEYEREAAEYEADLFEKLEERSLAYAWQQDLIDLHRLER